MYYSAHKSLTLNRQNSLTYNLLLTICSVVVILSVHDPDSQVLHFLKTNTVIADLKLGCQSLKFRVSG